MSKGDEFSLVVGDGWIPHSDFSYREVAGRRIEFRPPHASHLVRLTSKNAVALEHLTGIINDLQATVRYCALYETSFTDELDPAIQDALWKAALVTYARCFEKGVRKSERPDLRVFDELGDARRAHDYFITLRSKYVAHSVNALETNMTYALLTTVRGVATVVRGPGTFQISSNPLDEDGTDTLRRLAQLLLSPAQSRHQELTEVVASELHAMTPTELAALPSITEHRAPDVDHIDQARK